MSGAQNTPQSSSQSSGQQTAGPTPPPGLAEGEKAKQDYQLELDKHFEHWRAIGKP